ncbi:hypothetical protein EV189_3714 [Motilibacter rhizosphaerae]|uniref:UDP-N-acetylmuramyl pentapeptide phosphotransferase/UDP-N-acetylglucosamine-1-phosphate transferase n=1 Tax=Motilibacter rhizosphaerae TaxID=598652 RepID=A0A4Q7NBM5_9ACTN|nr:hypothetical protein [Motilibacter rhizosphaerae]RZS80230.1 hypothetical protein EV189_3714 [Motilibacter rhizosphaerae]
MSGVRPAGAGAAAGALLAAGALRALRSRPPGGAAAWTRLNARGREVSLLAGPAYAGAAAAALLVQPGLGRRERAAAVIAVAAAGGLGVYDDLAGSGADRGLAGHLRALRARRLTTGGVKVLGLGAAGLAAGGLLRRGPLDAALAAGVVAGSANLANLLDLRPGRALKAGLLAGSPHLLGPAPARLLVAAPLGAAAALLPDDLGELVMLGDGGANALGAALGVAAAAGAGRRSLAARLAVLTALTLASERVSFTRVIAATPVLRELDALGRLP